MRSKDVLVGDFMHLVDAMHDRMVAARDRARPGAYKQLDLWATKVIDSLAELQRQYFFVSDSIDAEVALMTPKGPRPPNVRSLRPHSRPRLPKRRP
jgi:hypothetical protein